MVETRIQRMRLTLLEPEGGRLALGCTFPLTQQIWRLL